MFGMLDDVFSGVDGVAAMLLEQFGGTAILASQTVAENFACGINAEYEKKQISFVQESLKDFIVIGVGGVLAEANDIVGVILGTETVSNMIDKIEWNGITYTIYSHEKIKSGNETAVVRILGKVSNDV